MLKVKEGRSDCVVINIKSYCVLYYEIDHNHNDSTKNDDDDIKRNTKENYKDDNDNYDQHLLQGPWFYLLYKKIDLFIGLNVLLLCKH